MTNKHMELVGKWLADNDSVTLEELKANLRAARDEARTSYHDAAWIAAKAASAALASGEAARYAREAYADWAADEADHWVKRYEETTNDK
jgi:hypothetical protein